MTRGESNEANNVGELVPAIGDVAARSYLVIDISALDRLTVEAIQGELRDRGAPSVVLPDRWTRIVGRLATGEISGHGPLATHDDLLEFIDPDRSKTAKQKATRIWNAFLGAHSDVIDSAARGRLPEPYNDNFVAEWDLLLRLFVQEPHQETPRMDLEVLRLMLLPEEGSDYRAVDGIHRISTTSVNALSMFVNNRLGLTGEDALPTS